MGFRYAGILPYHGQKYCLRNLNFSLNGVFVSRGSTVFYKLYLSTNDLWCRLTLEGTHESVWTCACPRLMESGIGTELERNRTIALAFGLKRALADVWCLELYAGTLFVLLLKFGAVLSVICGILMAVSCWRHILQCIVIVWSFLRLLKLRKLVVRKIDLSRGVLLCVTVC